MLAQVEREVVVNGEGVEERAGLEDEGHADLLARHGIGGIEAVDGDAPTARQLQADDVFQEHALAGAAGAHEHKNLAGLHLEGDALEHLEFAEGLGEVVDLHPHGGGAAHGFFEIGGIGVGGRHGHMSAFVTK